jgi:predicted nucleic acid-binding protein
VHQGKLKKIANLNDSGFSELYEIITKNITILDQSIVDRIHYESALKLCSKIDIDDVPFVAFSFYLECKLWTGD